jgi:hypothetical protein
VSELLEDRLWLREPALELQVIVNLASDRPASNTDLSQPPVITRLRRLKRAIDGEGLHTVALRGAYANAQTVLTLKDLWSFLVATPRRDDPTLAWAREFCRRWAAVRGVTLSQQTRLTRGAETDCQAWLADLMCKSERPDRSKDRYYEEAKTRFSVGRRAFDRAWTAAIDGTGAEAWRQPGPRSGRESKRQ